MNFLTSISNKINGAPTPSPQGAINFSAPAPTRIRMMVTPEIAEDWLQRNNHNRKLRETVAMRYASDMESGRWKYNYATILIATDGTVIDGQHRLVACTLARVPFETDVVFGVDLEIQRYVDCGEVRTAADQGSLAGIKNAVRSAAISSMLLTHFSRGIASITNPLYRPSRVAVEKFMVENDEEIQAALQTNDGGRICAPRVIDFCSFLFRRQNTAKAEAFFKELSSGENVSKPVHLLRERLQFNWRAKAKLPPKELVALFFKAWVAYRDGKTIKCLKFGAEEEFPKI